MRLNKRLLISVGALAVCLGATVGTTFALFTSEKTVNNHINAGNLTCDFYLTEFVYDELDEDGLITSKTEDLTKWTGWTASESGVDLKVFSGDVISVDKFCPSMEGYAVFKVKNTGDIAFNYTFEVLNKKAVWADQTDKSSEFDTVMSVEVTGTSTDPVKKGQSVATNKVAFKFLNEASNDWQKATFSFDIQLVATQVTKQ